MNFNKHYDLEGKHAFLSASQHAWVNYDEGKLIGGSMVLGATDNAVALPTDTWSLENWSVEDYEALYEQIKAGEIKIDNTVVSDPSTMNLEHITFVK